MKFILLLDNDRCICEMSLSTLNTQYTIEAKNNQHNKIAHIDVGCDHINLTINDQIDSVLYDKEKKNDGKIEK